MEIILLIRSLKFDFCHRFICIGVMSYDVAVQEETIPELVNVVSYSREYGFIEKGTKVRDVEVIAVYRKCEVCGEKKLLGFMKK